MNTQDDKRRFTVAMLAMAEVFGETLSKLRLAVYFESLRRFSIEEVERGIGSATGESGRKFLPKPGEIAQAIEGRSEDRALLAWVRVERAMEHIGSYESVDFRDPVLHAAIDRLGGWLAVCDWRSLPPREYPFKRQEFLALYRALSTTREAPSHLPGRIEEQRRRDGYWQRGLTMMPALVGEDGREIGRRELPEGQTLPMLPAGDREPVDVKALIEHILRETTETAP